ncbi:MAG TPA: Uma2 family endonuclease [Chloroflexota bacterium]|nr:Uma2 family endonuclease [Chloroflexota bacterium]
MVVHQPGQGPITKAESDQRFMLLLEDDLEDSPWMVMGSLQFAAASEFFQSLRHYASRLQLPWFVAGMTPILYAWPDYPRKRQLAPDVFVAFAPDRPRTSFDREAEGGFPAFVLEVVSPSSADRDEVEKRTAYDMLGAREYALFSPFPDRPSRLAGYRRNESGRFEAWATDDQGRLWSDVLGLYLITQGTTIRAATRDGDLVPTLNEAVEAREREAASLREADVEIEQLRREIEDLRRQVKGEEIAD